MKKEKIIVFLIILALILGILIGMAISNLSEENSPKSDKIILETYCPNHLEFNQTQCGDNWTARCYAG